MSWTITKADIPFISLGAQMLACGGGGDTKTIEYLLLSIMGDSDVIIVKTVDELREEWTVPVAIMGSPVLLSEELIIGTEGSQLIREYERISGKVVNGLISIEIGGMNALVPLLIAIQTGLPVTDGDGMGRAFPELGMTTFSIAKVPLSPLILNVSGKTITFMEDQREEVILDKVQKEIVEGSGYAHVCCFGMTGRQLRSAMIPGTLRLAYKLGKSASEGQNENRLNSILSIFNNSLYRKPILVFEGRVGEVNRWFQNKLLVGYCRLDGNFSYVGRQIDLMFHNEFLSIKDGNVDSFTTPDLILVLNKDQFTPIGASDIQVGHSVLIIVIPAPSILRTMEALRYVGPEKFGLDGCYRPVYLQEGVEK